MPSQAKEMPTRFPVGTKFVIESRPARNGHPAMFSRYLELPDGRSFSLPPRKAPSKIRQRLRNRK